VTKILFLLLPPEIMRDVSLET